MKKYIALILAFALLSIGGLAAMAAEVNADKDSVTHTENAVYGDPTVAEGIKVTSRSHYQNHLVWDSVYTVGEGTETDFGFHLLKQYSNGKPTLSAFTMYSDIHTGFSTTVPASEQIGLAKLYKELYDSLDYEEEGSVTARIADYYDYYPLNINVNLPDLFFDANTSDFNDGSYISTINGQEEKELYNRLCDFFKIPVLEEEYIDINVKKHRNGIGFGSGWSDKTADYYSMSTYSTYTDSTCFIYVSNRTENGNLMDFSAVPGGYGIYALPYGNGQLKVDGLSMVYALDEEASVNYMTVNEEGAQLLLSVVEDETTYLEVIDITTMSRLQKIEVCKGQPFIIYQMDGFIAYEFADHVAVIEENEGVYELKFVCDKFNADVGESEPFYFRRGAAMDFNGEHLVMVDNLLLDEGWYDKCGFFIAVYGKEGLLYYGEYENSLDANASSANHYTFNCQPMQNFEVEW